MSNYYKNRKTTSFIKGERVSDKFIWDVSQDIWTFDFDKYLLSNLLNPNKKTNEFKIAYASLYFAFEDFMKERYTWVDVVHSHAEIEADRHIEFLKKLASLPAETVEHLYDNYYSDKRAECLVIGKSLPRNKAVSGISHETFEAIEKSKEEAKTAMLARQENMKKVKECVDSVLVGKPYKYELQANHKVMAVDRITGKEFYTKPKIWF